MSSVDDIKARLDIVETVSGYVSLQKSGRYFKALCPFHTEKTPSFIVNTQRQSWRCFGACATGGDAFSFVMRMEGLDFGEALRLLARKVGVELSREGGGDRNEALHRINQVATRFYQDVLSSAQGQQARAYLQGRGVSEEAISKFELGLSPEGWDGLKSHLLTLGLTEEQAVQAGLLHRAESGNTFDFFRGRLMFPIHDRSGRVAGFGARALDDPSAGSPERRSPTIDDQRGRTGHSSTPKYLNTSSTPIFDKRNTLYGLHLADGAIRAQKTGIVVEGYMDVVAAHQYGYGNVVASMGTALTEQQVSQLRSLAADFVLALDPDAAGQEATLRSLESSWRIFERQAVDDRRRSVGLLYQREPLSLRIASLPAGRDPDTLIREDAQEWERLTREAVPVVDFCISAVASRFDLSTPQGKTQVVEVLAPMITSADPIEQEHYVGKLAVELRVSEEALKASIGRLRTGGPQRDRRRSGAKPPEVSASALSAHPESSLEDYALALLLRRPELKELARGFSPEHFHKAEDREVFTLWIGSSTMDDLRGSLDGSLHGHLAYLTQMELVSTDPQKSEFAVAQCLGRLERRHLQELQEGLLATEDASLPPPREIESAITDVNARLKQLFSERTRQGSVFLGEERG